MSARRHTRPSPALIVAVAALVVALGGVAYSAIPGPGGVIHACRDVSTGALRVEDSAVATDDCATPREAPLTWSQQGPPGPHGAPGQAGAQGPQGPPGLPPAYTRFVKTATVPQVSDSSANKGTVVAKLDVPAGRYVMIAKANAGAASGVAGLAGLATAVQCFLLAGQLTSGGTSAEASDFATVTLPADPLSKSAGITLLLAHEFMPGPSVKPGAILLRCRAGLIPSLPILIRNVRLVAMRVAELPELEIARALVSKPATRPKVSLKRK